MLCTGITNIRNMHHSKIVTRKLQFESPHQHSLFIGAPKAGRSHGMLSTRLLHVAWTQSVDFGGKSTPVTHTCLVQQVQSSILTENQAFSSQMKSRH